MSNSVNDKLQKEMLQHGVKDRKKFEKNLLAKVDNVISKNAENSNRIIRSKQDKKIRVKELVSEIYQANQPNFEQASDMTKQSLFSYATDCISYTFQKIEAKVSKLTEPKLPAYDPDIVEKQTLYKNKNLLQGWQALSEAERIRLEKVIKKGLQEGKTANQIALDVRAGNVHKITRQQAKGLVTTAITAVQSAADDAVYQENKDILRGWQFVATLDERTSYICMRLNGRVFKIDEQRYKPPLHFNCRSITVPVVKSFEEMPKQIQEMRNRLSKKELDEFDGKAGYAETYTEWLKDHPEMKLKNKDVEDLTADAEFLKKERFDKAKERIRELNLHAAKPEDLYDQVEQFKEYFKIQAGGDLNGQLSYMNYRGISMEAKKRKKYEILNYAATEQQLRYNPVTNQYEDVRLYAPCPFALSNSKRLINESTMLTEKDKKFINDVVDGLDLKMSINQRAVISENLRTIIQNARKPKAAEWGNIEGVIQGQMKYDLRNVSDTIERYLRKDNDPLKKLKEDCFYDPVLGEIQLKDVQEHFIDNIIKRNKMEISTLPKIARRMLRATKGEIPKLIRSRITSNELRNFYGGFLTNHLAAFDCPDRDSLAVYAGRFLHNAAGLNGNIDEWYKLGRKILDSPKMQKFYDLETFGVQKRRLRSAANGAYFGQAYDTLSYNLRLKDPQLREYLALNRRIDLGFRLGNVEKHNQLIVLPGQTNYFIKHFGFEDSGIPIMTQSAVTTFPKDVIDNKMCKALNWMGNRKYNIDEDYYDAINRLINFVDDKGQAKHYEELNNLKHHLIERSDFYDRFKVMDYYRKNGKAFSNTPFLDHRARVYDRGFIGAQAGETFRPFLNTAEKKPLGEDGYKAYNDLLGGFFGGLSDTIENGHNSLSVLGRQDLAVELRPQLIKVGRHLLRGKGGDIRAVLEDPLFSQIDGEDLAKAYRFAIENAKMEDHLMKYDSKTPWAEKNLKYFNEYMTGLAMEQDASSSGAQIIALTTKNKQLGKMCNVVNTNQKQRLYDEIAHATFMDPRFQVLNERLQLKEKELRKAAKAQNMVTLYGAGKATAVMNVEAKLSKVLNKKENVIVVASSDKKAVMDAISMEKAKYKVTRPEIYAEFDRLAKAVKGSFDNGRPIGDDLMEQLYFLDDKTRSFVEKLNMVGTDGTVTVLPSDFQKIGDIMSDHLFEKAPILREFTKYCGSLADTYLRNAKPSEADFDFLEFAKLKVFKPRKSAKAFVDEPWNKYMNVDSRIPSINQEIKEFLNIKSNDTKAARVFSRLFGWSKDSFLMNVTAGRQYTAKELAKKTGAKAKLENKPYVTGWKYGGIDFYFPMGFEKIWNNFIKTGKISVLDKKTILELKIGNPGVQGKKWTRLPWVNFDGKVMEQDFSKSYEKKFNYYDEEGTKITNIVSISDKNELSAMKQFLNEGRFDTNPDILAARTAYGVNGNHSNDATLVKNILAWGSDNNIGISTVHDAFFSNMGDILKIRDSLHGLYANTLEKNVIKATLDEMLVRGLPKHIYEAKLKEAIERGLIPVAGKSIVGGKILQKEDILTPEDLGSHNLNKNFDQNKYWYGIG